MLRLRARLTTILDRTGVAPAFLAATAKIPSSWQRLTVMSWHRVTRDVAPGFDQGVADATPEQFSRQLAILKEHFSLVDIADIVRYRDEGRPLLPNPALLSFDDGYRDCLATALPILRRNKARAVFFVPTAYMGTGRLFPWERVGATLARSPRSEIDINYPEPVHLSLRDDAARTRSARRLDHLFRTHTGIDESRFHDELAAACEVYWDQDIERKLAADLILDWDGVRALVDAGMDVQSHSDTHAYFPCITADDVLREASTSRQVLEQQIGEAPTALAYPAGDGLLPGNPGHTAIAKAGYRVAFILGKGARRLGSIWDWLNIPRIASERGMTEDQFRGSLAFPTIRY
jgi:peptidoglycan/xylan/chitin deacetylase (PgdA/CDA1 family)